MSGNKYLEMSDADFLNSPEYLTGVIPEVTPDTPVNEEPVVTEPTPEVVTPVVEPEVVVTEPVVTEESKPDEITTPVTPAKAEDEITPVVEGEEDKPVEPAPIDYEALYKKVTAPLKIKGKTIEIKSEEDVIRLMQQGAGFGRKMQDIQPHLKTLKFLEQNNLLNVDQADLAFLVDLKNKNPDAIKKLVKDSGIDPLDFNNEEPVVYKSNIQPVTDQQVLFREALDNLAVGSGGTEVLATLNTWDPQSHQAFMNNPELLEVLRDQKEHGYFDRIMAEVDRLKALGTIPLSTPTIAAYKQVGDHLRDTNGFEDLIEKQRSSEKPVAPVPAQPQLLNTRVAAPKPSVTNNDKVKAAAATKSTPAKTAPLINPLAMSDEDFQKMYGNR